jgi:hypothetical protein
MNFHLLTISWLPKFKGITVLNYWMEEDHPLLQVGIGEDEDGRYLVIGIFFFYYIFINL